MKKYKNANGEIHYGRVYGDEKTSLTLTPGAEYMLSVTDPCCIWEREIELPNGDTEYRYDMLDGPCGMTEDEVSKVLEDSDLDYDGRHSRKYARMFGCSVDWCKAVVIGKRLECRDCPRFECCEAFWED